MTWLNINKKGQWCTKQTYLILSSCSRPKFCNQVGQKCGIVMDDARIPLLHKLIYKRYDLIRTQRGSTLYTSLHFSVFFPTCLCIEYLDCVASYFYSIHRLCVPWRHGACMHHSRPSIHLPPASPNCSVHGDRLAGNGFQPGAQQGWNDGSCFPDSVRNTISHRNRQSFAKTMEKAWKKIENEIPLVSKHLGIISESPSSCSLPINQIQQPTL